MKYSILILVLFLAACAYPGAEKYSGASDQEVMKKDLRDCQHEAIKKYNDSELPMTGEQVAGTIVGGAAGGMIGGVILGAALGTDDVDSRHTMKLSEIDNYVDKCMKAKGYALNEHSAIN